MVDSIRKLVPEDIQARIKKMGAEGDKGSVDGYSGAAGRMRAAMNAAWLDELVPLMYHAGCSIVFVGREAEDPTADARNKQFGNDWKLTGGKALFFDSSLVVRVSRASFVTVGPEKEKTIVGERHRVEIHKTKVSRSQDRTEEAFFHTANGVEAPEGFDRARDVLMVGEELGLVKRAGSWISFGGKRWQGESRFVEAASPELLDELERAARERFDQDAKLRSDVLVIAITAHEYPRRLLAPHPRTHPFWIAAAWRPQREDRQHRGGGDREGSPRLAGQPAPQRGNEAGKLAPLAGGSRMTYSSPGSLVGWHAALEGRAAVKILHTGDWHLEQVDRRHLAVRDVEKAAWQTVEHAVREQVSLYCFTGDLANPNAGPVVIRCVELAARVAVTLAGEHIESAWVAGNHDVFEDASGFTTLSPLR